MTNEYVITRDDIQHPTCHYGYAATSEEAVEKFRKYWCITAPVTAKLLRTNVLTPLEEVN